MADLNAKILPLHTETAGRIPDDATLTSLGKPTMDVGEIALNLEDRKIFSKNSLGDIVELGGSGSSDFAGSITGLTEVDLVLSPYSWFTDFEVGDPNPGGYATTAQAYNGTRSWGDSTVARSTLEPNVYTNTSARYTLHSCWRYMVQDSTYDLWGNSNGNDRLIVTYREPTNSIRVYGYIGQILVSSPASSAIPTLNTWQHWLVQIDWGAGVTRSTTPFVSVWLDGALVADNLSTATSVGTGVTGPAQTGLLLETNDGFLDALQTTESDLPVAEMSQATIDPASVDRLIRGDQLSDNDTLLWDSASETFKVGPNPTPRKILELEDVTLETRLPAVYVYQEDASRGPGKWVNSSSLSIDLHSVDDDGADIDAIFSNLPTTGTVYLSSDGTTYVATTYSGLANAAADLTWVFTLDTQHSLTGPLYVSFDARVVGAQLPRVGEVLAYDGAGFTPAPLTDKLRYGLENLKGVGTLSPAAGQALVWDAAAGEWIAGNAAAGGSIDTLDDVDVTTNAPVDGQVLTWVAASGAFEPADSVSRIQDATDFELNQVAGSYTLTPGNSGGSQPPSAEAWGTTASGGNYSFIFHSDSNARTELDALQVGDDIEFLFDDTTTLTTTIALAASINSASSRYLRVTDPWPAEAASATDLVISSSTFGSQFTPLADGDLIAWDATAQRFKPTQDGGGGSIVGVLGDLTDVDLTTNAVQEGDTLVYDSAQGVWKPGGPTAGWLTTRVDEVETTLSLASNGEDDLTFDGIGSVGEFVSITVSEPAWVRFYPTAAQRVADASRTSDTDPDPGAGVFLEVLTTTSGEVVNVTPGASYYNNNTPAVDEIYARVTNLSGATNAITVTVRAYAQADFTGFSGGTYGSG